MDDKTVTPNWISRFPGLRGLSREAAGILLASSKVVRLPTGTRVFGPGQAPDAFLLLIGGTVRVQQVTGAGREIVLYRISAGESCALTTACLMGYDDYQAEAIAESAVEAVAVPRATFDDLIARSPEFRRFVFAAFSQRITDLFRVIEEVAFARVDVRLAQRLLERANAKGHIDLTHQQLAAELGTAREVVSRQLNEFQRRGWLSTSRGAIDLLKPDALRQLAAAP